jgi:hypothetical protein
MISDSIRTLLRLLAGVSAMMAASLSDFAMREYQSCAGCTACGCEPLVWIRWSAIIYSGSIIAWLATRK